MVTHFKLPISLPKKLVYRIGSIWGCAMLHHGKRELDPERGGPVEEVLLDFKDPSWILDYHRVNLIRKITRPERSSSLLRFLERYGRSTSAHSHDDRTPRTDQDLKRPRDNDIEGGRENPSAIEHSSNGRQEDILQSYRIDLVELQRMHLRELQCKLVKHTVDLTYNAREPFGWAEDLRRYGKYNIGQPHICPLPLSSQIRIMQKAHIQP